MGGAIATKPVSDHRSNIVVVAGSVTTLIALAGVYALAHSGENIMGWYANYIIPIGALLVGVVASAGYGIAAWVTGLKMTRRLMLSVVGQLLLAYFIAQYEEYQRGGFDMGFWSWFDAVTQSFNFADHSGHPGSAFGALGYGMRALEIAGFVGGGLLVPGILRSKPYCDPCRTYRRTKDVTWFGGGLAAGSAAISAIFTAAADHDHAAFTKAIALHGSEKSNVSRLPARIAVRLVRCPRCDGGALVASRLEGHGKHTRTTQVATEALDGDQTRALFE